jgi:hypothetical protein
LNFRAIENLLGFSITPKTEGRSFVKTGLIAPQGIKGCSRIYALLSPVRPRQTADAAVAQRPRRHRRLEWKEHSIWNLKGALNPRALTKK